MICRDRKKERNFELDCHFDLWLSSLIYGGFQSGRLHLLRILCQRCVGHANNVSEFVCVQVQLLISRCTCPSQFPMVKVSEGKYRVGHSNTLIFVRVLYVKPLTVNLSFFKALLLFQHRQAEICVDPSWSIKKYFTVSEALLKRNGRVFVLWI